MFPPWQCNKMDKSATHPRPPCFWQKHTHAVGPTVRMYLVSRTRGVWTCQCLRSVLGSVLPLPGTVPFEDQPQGQFHLELNCNYTFSLLACACAGPWRSLSWIGTGRANARRRCFIADSSFHLRINKVSFLWKSIAGLTFVDFFRFWRVPLRVRGAVSHGRS